MLRGSLYAHPGVPPLEYDRDRSLGPPTLGATYTWLMPTPVGPVPPDPNDPDLWDWGEFNDDTHPRRRPWHLVLVGIVVLGLVLLLVVNIL